MSLSNGFDVRASSLVDDINAAIERVVAHFEDNDIALRVDVLRALAAQAKLSFETERMKERLRQHPITRDLIDAVTTRSSVYERLAAGLAVQEFSSEYDAQRNVEILATVQWLLKEDDAKQKKSKKRKTQSAAAAASLKADRSVPLILRYSYSRSLTNETTTLVEFRVTSCVGNGGKPKELVHFAISSSAPYPRSFYEDVNDGGLSDGEDNGDDDEEAKQEETTEEADDLEEVGEEGDSDDDQQQDGSDQQEAQEGDAEGDDQQDGSEAGSEQPEGLFGEAVEAFAFDESAVEDILAWLGEEDHVDPADVVGFFLALPVYEDEWQLDERITEIVFNGQSESDGDDEEEENASDQE